MKKLFILIFLVASCQPCKETICVEYETREIFDPETMITIEYESCVKTAPNPDYQKCINNLKK